VSQSASVIAAEVAAGRRTARDTVGDALLRLEEAQDRFNACTLIDRAGAEARAEEIDQARAAGETPGPLAGVPVVVKDLIDQAGLPTTCGSGFYRQVAAASAPVIRRLEAAGAVMVARAGLHEFAYGFSSENPWFGPIRNPWDPDTSPGGSSGGSAVAVAAGLVPLSLGTDTGGSVRVPAALTGVCGLKVTQGRLPTEGVFPLAPSLDTVGPLATGAGDLALAYRVMAATAPPLHDASWVGIRVGLPRAWLEGPTQPPVAAAFEEALRALRDLGAVTVDLDLPLLVPWGMIQELAGAEAAHVHRRFLAEGKPYGEEVGQRLAAAARVTSEQYLDAQTWRARLIESWAVAFNQVDVIATPAVAALRKEIGVDQIEGQHYRPVLSWFSALVNHAGVPALAMPLAGSGEPPGSLQLIAGWWQEERLLSLAAAAEAAGLVGHRPPPGVLV
jgi:aspartyl-tRNA(Asn)/glutamyl-tRNA(Gln) amidotransferase subunit A